MISALVGHLVGDYLLQNEWMAAQKKSKTWPCLVHCFIWAACVTMFADWGLVAFVVLLVTHFIQDRTNIVAWYMDNAGQHNFRVGPFAPWSIVVVDNVLHILTIWIIWKSGISTLG